MIKFKSIIINICLSILAISLVLILVFFSIQKKPKEFTSARTALIDEIGNNYIFRGNNPFVTKNNEKVFAYDELTSSFNNILQEQGLEELQDYYLIDISLLDLDEFYEIKKEQKFFAQHPEHRGKMLNISTISPSLLLESLPASNVITKYAENNYNLQIRDTLNKIRDMASQKTIKPIVIYIHCNGGRDRTGLIAASYRLSFNNMTLSQVRSQNIVEVGRNTGDLYNQAMKSYCLHVQNLQGKEGNYCI